MRSRRSPAAALLATPAPQKRIPATDPCTERTLRWHAPGPRPRPRATIGDEVSPSHRFITGIARNNHLKMHSHSPAPPPFSPSQRQDPADGVPSLEDISLYNICLGKQACALDAKSKPCTLIASGLIASVVTRQWRRARSRRCSFVWERRYSYSSTARSGADVGT